jgi:HK97 family phage prohead protease
MTYKTLKLTEFKKLTEEGTFEGYLAYFNNRDHGGDMIVPGAFTKTLKDKKGRVPLLDGHDTSKRLGFLELEEDGRGLKVLKGTLNLAKSAAQEAYADLLFYNQNELPLGMSIGYDTIKSDWQIEEDKKTRTRLLKEVALWEGSLVTFGMNPKAKVTNVKEMVEEAILDHDKAVELIEAIKAAIPIEELKALLAPPEAAQEPPEPAAIEAREQGYDLTWIETLRKQLKGEN